MPYKKFLQLLLPIDVITLGYIILTGFYIFIGAGNLDKLFILIGYRVLFIAIITMVIFVNSFSNIKFIRFFRSFYPLALLFYFYPETASINNFIFKDLDPLVANLEVTIFGGFPSVWFSQYMPWKWFSELMHFGYFSYFPLIFILCYSIYKKSFENFNFVIFVICMSFYMYYIFFILFPVAGPQYYLIPPDNQVTDGYLFRDILQFMQNVGEGPTGAFPSSHVGIITIVLFLAFKFRKPLLKWFIPISIILYFSTVYIKAHYVIDVIAGFLTVPTMYWISSHTYNLLFHGLGQHHKIQQFVERVSTSIRSLYKDLIRRKT